MSAHTLPATTPIRQVRGPQVPFLERQPSLFPLEPEAVGSSWDAGGGDQQLLHHHLREWVEGSAVHPDIARLALESISGDADVLSFLRPRKLGRIGGYATMPVKEARRAFAGPIKGGWLATGLNFLDSRPEPVTFKADHPRLAADGDPIKYERPSGQRAIPYFTPLPPAAVAAICSRARITPPEIELDPWMDAWTWLLAQGVHVFFVEGEKKAAAMCSAGLLAIGLPGIWGGCPRPRDAAGVAAAEKALIPELQEIAKAVPGTIFSIARRCTIVFDESESRRGRRAIRCATRTLGTLLEQAGAHVNVCPSLPTGPDGQFLKGVDDVAAALGAEALADTLEQALPLADWLKVGSAAAVRDHLLEPFSTDDRKVRRIGGRHFCASDIPDSKLVCMIGGMGSNKTGAVSQLDAVKFVLLHRRALADQAAARFDVPIKREGLIRWTTQAQQPLRQTEDLAPQWLEHRLAGQTGFATVLDSSYLGGSGELNPRDLEGNTLVIDEADAVLLAAVAADTAVADHRDEVLSNLRACVAAAARVVLLGAHLDEDTISAFEKMAGAKAHIVTTTLQPAAGRDATIFRFFSCWLEELERHCIARKPVFITTTSCGGNGSGSIEGSDGKNSATTLESHIREWWPDARILAVTGNTSREKAHPAAAALADPARFLSYDVVIASPIIETGLSIEDPDGHFQAVFTITGSGHVGPQALVQASGRLRSNAPRFILPTTTGHGCPSPGTSGTWADEVRGNNEKAELALRRAGFLSAIEQQLPDGGLDFRRLWATLVAKYNWVASEYREAVATLLENEGYKILRLDREDRGAELIPLIEAAADEAARFRLEREQIKSTIRQHKAELAARGRPPTKEERQALRLEREQLTAVKKQAEADARAAHLREKALRKQLNDKFRNAGRLIEEIEATAEKVTLEQCQEVASASPLTTEQRAKLREQGRLSREQRAALNRAALEEDLGIAAPTAQQVRNHRADAPARLLLRILATDPAERQAHADALNRYAPPGRQSTSQDRVALQRHALRASILEALDIQQFIAMAGTGQGFWTGDTTLEALRTTLLAHSPGTVKVGLGITPTEKTTSTTLVRHLLRSVGLELKNTGRRNRAGQSFYVVEELHRAIDVPAALAHIRTTHLERIKERFNPEPRPRKGSGGAMAESAVAEFA